VSVLFGALLLLGVGVLAVTEVAPALSDPPATGLQLYVVGPDGLASINVDSGRITPIVDDPDIERLATNADVAIIQRPNPDRLFADTVVSYSEGTGIVPIGEADRVLFDEQGALWLVIDAAGRVNGGAAITSASGGWRSRVFAIPAGRQVVGTSVDGLVTLKGSRRGRMLQVWDPQLDEVVRSMGLVTGVGAVAGSQVLVSLGCLSKGCQIAVVDATTGKRTPLALPTGWVESGPATLTTDGTQVVQVVAGLQGGTGLAVGGPSSMTVNSDVVPAVGTRAFAAQSDWIVVTSENGDAVLVRENDQVTVNIPPRTSVVGVGGSDAQ
jgi:hypothetical protein